MGKRAEICSPPESTAPSLWHLLTVAADEHPNRPAVTMCHQDVTYLSNLLPQEDAMKIKGPSLTWTYRQLRYAVLLVAKTMLDTGGKRGSTMMVLMDNGIEPLVLQWTTAVLQMMSVPLAPALLEPSRKGLLEYFIKKIQPCVVVVPDVRGADAFDKVADSVSVKPDVKFVFAGPTPQGWNALADLKPNYNERELLHASAGVAVHDLVVENNGNRVASMLFTSGTSTGTPKGCPCSAHNILASIAANCALTAMPTSWVIQNLCRGAIWVDLVFLMAKDGKHLVIPSAVFEPSATLHAIEQCQAEHVLCMGAHLHLMGQDASFLNRNLNSVVRVGLGGDMVTVDAMAKAQQYFPNALVTPIHGMTEGSGLLGLEGTDMSKALPVLHGILTCGRPLRGANVRICDAKGNVLGRGEEGELHLGGTRVIDHYLDGVQAEMFYHDAAGNWMKTGDKTVVDEDGYVFILGRMKDIIKQSGWSLSPAMIESEINKHDFINSRVIAFSHPVKGEVPVAICQDPLDHTRSPREWKEQIQRWVSESLPPEFALENVFFLSELGMATFPLNSTGKVEKTKLKEAAVKLQATPSGQGE